MGILEGILYMIWRGLAIGIIISAPMGPVGILCVQRTLSKGRHAGFYTGVGAAISDLFYCLLTGFGLSFIEEFLEENQNVIQILGSVVLMAFAAYLFFSNPSRSIKKPGESSSSPKRDVINGFLFTVSNPLIIFLIIGLFARFNFLLPEIQIGHYFIGFLFIIIGALGWWWVVTFFVDKVRAHFNLRSMWLINKITGSIIAIFGVVGVVTAIVGLANAAPMQPRYLNSVRGFGQLTSDTVFMTGGIAAAQSAPLAVDPDDFTLRFQARNLHNRSGSRYDTPRGKTLNPAWSLKVTETGADTLSIIFKTIDDYRDPLGPMGLRVTAKAGNTICRDTVLHDHINWFTDWNSFSLSHKGTDWKLMGGDRAHYPILNFSLPDFRPETLRFSTDDGALLDVDWITLNSSSVQSIPTSDKAYLSDPDRLEDYLNRSLDSMEGIWQIFDHSFDDDYIRPGGNYRMAMIDNGNGYDLIYLSGAVRNPGLWKPGKLKAHLTPDAFSGIYTVTWYDADGNSIASDIKGEVTDTGVITILFPYLNSTLRLRKVVKYSI